MTAIELVRGYLFSLNFLKQVFNLSFSMNHRLIHIEVYLTFDELDGNSLRAASVG